MHTSNDRKNTIRPNPVGYVESRSSKQGGGEFVVISHVDCERQGCSAVAEVREVQYPSKAQRKNGHYFSEYTFCPTCKLYTPKEGTKVFFTQ